MDLISREAIHEREITNPENDYEYGWNEALAETDVHIPSAFEGKTNGEVIQALFPNSEVVFTLFNVPKSDVIKIDNEAFLVERSWWNSPYKGVSE